MLKKIALSVLTLSLAISAHADMTAREIIEKVDDNQLATTDSAFTKMKLTSCKYGLKAGKIKCVEKPRIKVLESVQINTGENEKDSKALMVVLEPARERGIGMLSFSYDDEAKANESWLYLSALGKVKRIASGTDEEESEPQSLFGSEFTTEDQETGKLDDYVYTLQADETIKGRDTWVITSTPTEKRLKTSRYSKTITWVDKERFVPVKTVAYNKKGVEVKRFNMDKFEHINGTWMARSITVLNLVSSRLSNISQQSIIFGVDINESFLSTRALTDKVYREQGLKKLRAQAK